MTDEQIAANIMRRFAPTIKDFMEADLAAAIVRALQQAREEGKRSSFDSTNPPNPKPLVWLNGKKVAPAGHIIDDQGVVRKVDTTGWDPADTSKPVPLPVYADGELWMMGELAYTIHDGTIHEFYADEHNPAWTNIGWVIRWGEGEIELSKCYSTREAAEAAKEDER